MSQQPEDVVRDIYAAFGRGDIPTIVATVDEGITWRVAENLPHGGSFQGRDDIGRFFQGIGDHWEDLHLDVEQMVCGGDTVVALCHIQGRLRASGENTGWRAAHTWVVRDGRPVRFTEYADAPLSLPAAHAVAH